MTKCECFLGKFIIYKNPSYGGQVSWHLWSLRQRQFTFFFPKVVDLQSHLWTVGEEWLNTSHHTHLQKTENLMLVTTSGQPNATYIPLLQWSGFTASHGVDCACWRPTQDKGTFAPDWVQQALYNWCKSTLNQTQEYWHTDRLELGHNSLMSGSSNVTFQIPSMLLLLWIVTQDMV